MSDNVEKIIEQINKDTDERNSFWKSRCLLCNQFETEQITDMQAHLRDVHDYTLPIQGNKRMQMHLDATEWFQTNYVFSKDGVDLVTILERDERAADDLFRLMGDEYP